MPHRRLPLVSLLAMIAVIGCVSPYPYEPWPPRAAPALGVVEDGKALIDLFYATDRRETNTNNPQTYWGSDRTYDLKLGRCEASIPPKHGRGRLEFPAFGSPTGDSDVMITGIETPDECDAFIQALRAQVDQSPRRELFLFVHGFYVNFYDAARRTAQIAHDVDFEGPACVYSWPTQGWFLSYFVDAANVEWSEPYLVELLALLVDQSGAEHVHLMAHSMGARLLSRALRDFMQARRATEEPPFDQIVLAAADMDAEIFARDYARYVAAAGRRVTIYFSAADWALGGSAWLQKYDRLGQSGLTRMPPRLADRVELIDATAVDKGAYGHIYYGESPRILDDVAQLLAGKSAAERGLPRDGRVYRILNGASAAVASDKRPEQANSSETPTASIQP